MPNCWFCYKNAGGKEYHLECSKRFFGTTEAPVLELNNKILKDLGEKTVNKRIAVTGVQPKLSVTLEKVKDKNRLTIVGLWGEYILKPFHAKYPHIAETEDLTMHLASVFGINVCKHALIRATDGSLAYIAKRFDREKKKKIHIEDFCQLSEFPTENKYKGSYEQAGKIILKYCSNAGFDALNYFELLLFSYLTNNNDMHLKNFSLIYKNGAISLSPAYDLLNVKIIYPKDPEDLALMLGGKKTNIQKIDFINLGRLLKISDKAIEKVFEKFHSHNDEINQWIDNSFLGEKEKKLYKDIWLKKQRKMNK
jgi:serine/threonine-protein kinase HipA